MQNRDRKLQPLLDSQRQALGTRAGDLHEVETLQQLVDATLNVARRQMIELSPRA